MAAVTHPDPVPGTHLRPACPGAGRLEAVDLLRGVVMILMVLDHTREFFTDPHVEPTDLDRASLALFLTRWVSHFCAPVFVFLAGASSYLAHAAGKFPTARALAGYLATRGLFLMVLEVTLVRLGWNFNLDYSFVLLQVIWVIGAGMVSLAGLVALGLSSRTIGILGLILIAGHNLLDTGSLTALVETLKQWTWPWALLARPGGLVVGPVRFQVAYPLLPWFGVMAAGFAFGEVLMLAPRPRSRVTLALGMALSVLYVLLRAWNGYGDPSPWKSYDSAARTLLSFLNCQKYPPSLQYVLMALGPGLVFLAGFLALTAGRREAPGSWTDGPRRVTATLGRVPLFYYLLQWPVVHLLANIAALLSGQPIRWSVWSFDYPAGYGYGLPVVYAMWALTIALVYFPCRWFAGYKRRHRDAAWLSYL